MLKFLAVVLALVIVLPGTLRYGACPWNAATRQLRTGLDMARVSIQPQPVDFGELGDLPAPVERYFRSVLKKRQPTVAGVRLRHTGSFNTGQTTDQSRPFTSDPKVVAQRPGFDWDGRVVINPKHNHGGAKCRRLA
jgi:hypothetical protein